MCRLLMTTVMAALIAGTVAAQDIGTLDQRRAKQFAVERGWLTRAVDAAGGVVELQSFERGRPRYYSTHNIDAADSVSTDECWSGGSGGLSLSGSGVTLGIWDAARVYNTHREFQGRASQIDSPSGFSWHSTHVSATMIAAGLWPGNASFPAGISKGMAPLANLDCYDWNSDETEMSAAAGVGLRVSNHSYGFITGWTTGNFGAGSGWYWFGDVTVSTVEDHEFGRYDTQARDWDQIAVQNPSYLFIKSAGNDRNEGPNSGTQHFYWLPGVGWRSSTAVRNRDGNSGYDSVSHSACAKNGLTVGAVHDVAGGYSGAGGVVMTSFSCWGPADDGRIKPDLVANGQNLFSAHSVSGNTDFWAVASGTSMSSPNTSGSLGLLIEHWRNTHASEPDMRAATLKGLVLQTADECGSWAGPDYVFGWGLLNTLSAAQAITADVAQPLTISEWNLAQNESLVLDITTNGTSSELRATICWTDPAATPPANVLDLATKVLVNDLDLRIDESGGPTHAPWMLDVARPASAATTGDNDSDNVEQVVITSPGSGNFTLRVTHKGALSGGSQDFSLIISGASQIAEPGALIGGFVTTNQGTPVENVDARATTAGISDPTDATGHYQLSLPIGTSETVTPCRDGWQFTPISRTYNPVSTSLSAENYTGVLVYDVDPPGSGDDFVGVGDLSRFSTAWQQAVPANDPNDFDCDNFVGVGDLSFFITAWLKSVFDATIVFPACRQCGGFPEPTSPTRLELRLVAVVEPTPAEQTEQLPRSVSVVRVGESYFVEMWVRDPDDAGPGVTSAYADIAVSDSAVDVRATLPSTNFTTFASGSIEDGLVRDLGGSALAAGLGNKLWVRVAAFEVVATGAERVHFDPMESRVGFAAYGRGRVPWSAIEKNGAAVRQVQVRAVRPKE